jgi:membrane protease YdiL (CAAX protease family)
MLVMARHFHTTLEFTLRFVAHASGSNGRWTGRPGCMIEIVPPASLALGRLMDLEQIDLRPVLRLVPITVALFVFGLWFLAPGKTHILLPPQRRRCVPWTGFEVLAACFMFILFWPALAQTALAYTGLFGKDDHGNPPAPQFAAQFRDYAILLAFPFQLGTIPLLLRALSGTQPRQLGITGDRWGSNIAVGAIGWIAFTPLTYVVLYICAVFMKIVVHVDPEEHKLLEQMGPGSTLLDRILACTVGCVAAPLLEELMFRGMLQPWFAARRWGGHLAMSCSLIAAVVFRMSHYRRTWAEGWGPFFNELGPVLFVLAVVPVYLLIWLRYRNDRSASGALPAVFGTSLLFATMHSSVWPHPVPLFFLALGLGLAAFRTQSLVPSVVMHSLFNSLPFVLLFMTPPHGKEPEKNGSGETSAARLVSPVSISTAVPASWCPRRRYARAMAWPNRGENTDEVVCPTSLSSRSSRAPAGAGSFEAIFKPINLRLGWPRSRAITIGSWPRKQPLVKQMACG